jgi:hypothetical protein
LLQALRKRRDAYPPVRIVLRLRHQRADAAHSSALLRLRRKRPRYRAADQRDELAPFQTIQLHAVPATLGRIARYPIFDGQ